MGWRFRKSLKILPGVRLNFGKGGFTSTTLGGRWLKTNVSGRGVKHTVGVPGTGLSYQTDEARGDARKRNSPSNSRSLLLVLVAVLLVLVLLAVVGVGILVVITR